jgi:hypothetical protein
VAHTLAAQNAASAAPGREDKRHIVKGSYDLGSKSHAGRASPFENPPEQSRALNRWLAR